jgi:hypothetical protein
VFGCFHFTRAQTAARTANCTGQHEHQDQFSHSVFAPSAILLSPYDVKNQMTIVVALDFFLLFLSSMSQEQSDRIE